MDHNQLYSNILRKGSFLCTGLDSDPALFPAFIQEREFPIFDFNRAIIDATIDYSVAYKPNLAFYEAEGAIGWEQLKMTVEYIRKRDPSVFIIADAKRGDIGNTAIKYASAFFQMLDFDAVTLSPYMGRDSVEPFLKYRGKWAIVLALTSNPSADDFETLNVGETPLYRRVIESVMNWGSQDNTMFVVGATRPEELAQIREYCPNHFLLVPGVGTQGGNVTQVAKYGMNSSCGLLVNVSRAISFAWMDDKTGRYSGGLNFDKAAGEAAALIVKEMRGFLAL